MSGYHDKNGFTSHVSCGSTGPLLHRLNYHYQALYTSPQPLSPSKHVTVPRPLRILRPENVLKICSNNIQFSIKIIKLTKSDHSMMRCKTNARKMLFAQGRMIRVAGRIFRTVFEWKVWLIWRSCKDEKIIWFLPFISENSCLRQLLVAQYSCYNIFWIRKIFVFWET